MTAPTPPHAELGPIAALLAESFDRLATRLPEGHALLRRELLGLSVDLDLDDEHVEVLFERDTIHVRPRDPDRPATVAASSAAILAVLDAERTLADAVEADLVRVRGSLDQLERLHAGLLIYMHAAVRCPGFAELLARLRLHARAHARGHSTPRATPSAHTA